MRGAWNPAAVLFFFFANDLRAILDSRSIRGYRYYRARVMKNVRGPKRNARVILLPLRRLFFYLSAPSAIYVK